MKRLAYFLPFLGCSRRCLYCDQRAITADARGADDEAVSPGRIESELSQQREPVELCFFGGSFARLEHRDFVRYLDCIRHAPTGSRITFSSYPGDFEGLEGRMRIGLLGAYPVGTIELGVPSLDPDVLRACGRSEDPRSILGSLVRLKEASFHLGVQIMTGLPEQSEKSVRSDLHRLSMLMEPEDEWDLRIYPCLVLQGTGLERLFRGGGYLPPSLENAVRLAGGLISLAESLGFRVIRVGLPESAALRRAVVAGPYHPAFGELALAERTVLEMVGSKPKGPWRIEKKKLSHLTGHGRRGIARLAELTRLDSSEVERRLTIDTGP